jgi:phosphoribosylaminoimidazolecarboxamide formyltransferase/IMP cyclohydrolase
MTKAQRALLSVTDKTGIVELAKELQGMGVEILSTGGTAKALTAANVPVVEVSDYTKSPEMFDGRVKTLHPKVHGGILYRRDNEKDVADAEKNGIKPIDMVVVNLYQFEKKAAEPNVSLDDLIESVDIGGPTMLMSGFKNHKHVAVVADPAAYAGIVKEMKETGEISADTRRVLAAYALNMVADYRAANAMVLTERLTGEKTLRLAGRKGKQLGRYGENWDQKAWKFILPGATEPNVATAVQLHGTPLGYNNYLDADAALRTVLEFDEPCAVVVKHTNPCGIATADTIDMALQKAWQGDIVSAFGSIIAFNREVDLKTVKFLSERVNPNSTPEKTLRGYFVEVLVAPSYSKEALEYLKEKRSKENLRVLAVGDLKKQQDAYDLRFIRGGILRQTRNSGSYLTDIDDCFKPEHPVKCENSGAERKVGVVTNSAPDPAFKGLYDFAWKAVKNVKSNAIAIAQEWTPGKYQLLGIGAGQMNRAESCRLAIDHAEATLSLEYNVAAGNANESQKAFFTGEEERLAALGKKIFPDGEQSAPTGFEAYRQEVYKKAVAASDAFFPFADGPKALLENGIRHFIQPGGGNKDQEVTVTVYSRGGRMIFTGKRNFLH